MFTSTAVDSIRKWCHTDLTTESLRCHAGIGNKKATNLHLYHTFWYTSLSSLLDYNV